MVFVIEATRCFYNPTKLVDDLPRHEKSYWTGSWFGARRFAKEMTTEEEAKKELKEISGAPYMGVHCFSWAAIYENVKIVEGESSGPRLLPTDHKPSAM